MTDENLPSLRSTLREQTRSAHESLDGSMATLDPFGSAEGYAVYLRGMHHLYAAHVRELHWVAQESGLEDNTAHLCKLIEQDLSDLFANDEPQQDCLSGSPPYSPITKDASTRIPADQGKEKSWGAAYVLEGSSMGARYIVRQVESNNAQNSLTLPTSFLTCVAQESYERWPKFTEALDQSSCVPEATVDAACRTFGLAKSIFQELAGELARKI